MKRRYLSLSLVFVAYVILVALFRWRLDWQWVFFVIGGALGLGFELVDRLVQVWVVKPQEQLSMYVKHMIRERRYREAFKVLQDRGHEQRLTSRSVMFMAGWILVGVYVLTSSGSMLAQGMVMGIGLRMLYELWQDWPDRELVRQRWFWLIKRRVTDAEVRGVLVGYTLIFMGLNLVLV